MFSRNKKKSTQLGAITLDNVLSIFSSGADGKPLAIVKHSIDKETIFTLAAVGAGLIYLSKKL